MNSNESWAVTVERNGENIVTVSSNCLSGRDLQDGDERTIRTAAEHLLSFIGQYAVAAETPRPAEQQAADLVRRWNSFLGNGGFFNPGMTASCNEDALRQLVLDTRDFR
jgi:hypothetical protein